jgi:hypothetical protein
LETGKVEFHRPRGVHEGSHQVHLQQSQWNGLVRCGEFDEINTARKTSRVDKAREVHHRAIRAIGVMIGIFSFMHQPA